MEDILGIAGIAYKVGDTNTTIVIKFRENEEDDEDPEGAREYNEEVLHEILERDDAELQKTLTLVYIREDDDTIVLPKCDIPLSTCSIFWDDEKQLGIRANERLYKEQKLSFDITISERSKEGLSEEALSNQFKDLSRGPGSVIKPDTSYRGWRQRVIDTIKQSREVSLGCRLANKYGKYLFNGTLNTDSADANCKFYMIRGDTEHMHFEMLRDIIPGEELIVNYGWSPDESAKALGYQRAKKRTGHAYPQLLF